MTDVVSSEARLSADVRERWDTGAVVDLTLDPLVRLSGWQVTVDLGGEVVNIWNAEVARQDGTVYTLRAARYNTDVRPGESVNFGVEVQGTGAVELIGFDTVAADDASDPRDGGGSEPAAAVPSADGGEGSPAGSAEGAQLPAPRSPSAPPLAEVGKAREQPAGGNGPGEGFPALTVAGETVTETPGTGEGLPGRDFDPGPLTTRGSEIVDAQGRSVPVHGLNWFGLETDVGAPHGLWTRNWRVMMDEVKDLGFNALRVPFSGELVATGGGEPTSIDFSRNPDLEGLDGLQILDAVVDYANVIGLRVLLDYHRNEPGDGPNESGLWYGNGWRESDVIDVWRTMAERYGDDPAVIGADLMNEPFGGTWGDDARTDWAAAAERIGNAVLAVQPDWLIVVEGISQYEESEYWWGGNLQGVADRPVRIDRPEQLVYSAHDYPASVFAQPWFFDGTDLTETFRENWGFIAEQGIAPVLIGEWGSFLETAVDQAWARALSDYLADLDLPWMWWSLNPNSGDTGGLFEDDWRTVRQDVTDLLDRYLDDTRPTVTFAEAAREADKATFTVSLAAPAPESRTVTYATADGTAVAGADYVATSGTLDFARGDRTKEVSVPILPDTQVEGDEYFYLVLSGENGPEASGTSVITDDGERSRRGSLAPSTTPASTQSPAQPATQTAQTAQPMVDVAALVVPDGASAARFRLGLTEPATRDITLDFDTRTDASDITSGSIVIPQGRREAVLEVSVEEARGTGGRFTLELTGADGATVREGTATAVLTEAANQGAEVTLARSAAENTQLVIDLILESDWGSGALFNVVIKNVSDTPVNGWQISMDLPFDLDTIWSAVLVDEAGDRLTLGNAQWNGDIAPGQSTDFGFIAEMGNISLQALLSNADLELIVP